MCTVSWFFHEDGFELFFNRDELRSRGLAAPPAPAVAGDVRYLAPTDRDAGGTWLAVNEHGTAVGLLNAHPAETRAQGQTVSRGLLVRRLADLRHAGELAPRLRRLDLGRLRPFTLLALSPGGVAAVVDWNGDDLEVRGAGVPPLLSSSSVDAVGAAAARRDLLAARVAEAGDLRRAHLEFHRLHEPERGPLSPCMHRADARTVSFCHVRMAAGEATLAYAPGPPCRTPLAAGLRLPRGAGAAPAHGAASVPGPSAG